MNQESNTKLSEPPRCPDFAHFKHRETEGCSLDSQQILKQAGQWSNTRDRAMNERDPTPAFKRLTVRDTDGEQVKDKLMPGGE